MDRFRSRLKLAHNIAGRDKVDRHYREVGCHRDCMAWESESLPAFVAHTFARMLSLHRRIRAATFTQPAFDYTHTHTHLLVDITRLPLGLLASSGFCGISRARNRKFTV